MATKNFSEILKEYSPVVKEESIKEKIRDIEKITKRKLIVYANNPQIPYAMINRLDVMGFEDILRSVEGDKRGDLLISSLGGEANAAEKFLIMCRQHFEEEFNVIIPDCAKSAATMIALGADTIFMGYCAELGPVDPQILIGPRMAIPAQSYISGLAYIRKKIKDKRSPDPVAMYLPILSKIKPELITICEDSIKHANGLVEKWLKKYMLKGKPQKAKKIARFFSEGKKYKSHGKVIDFEEAKNLGLNVHLIDKSSRLWKNIWELYSRIFVHMSKEDISTLFASEKLIISNKIKIMRTE